MESCDGEAIITEAVHEVPAVDAVHQSMFSLVLRRLEKHIFVAIWTHQNVRVRHMPIRGL